MRALPLLPIAMLASTSACLNVTITESRCNTDDDCIGDELCRGGMCRSSPAPDLAPAVDDAVGPRPGAIERAAPEPSPIDEPEDPALGEEEPIVNNPPPPQQQEPAEPRTLSIVASYAECVDPADGDAARCRETNGDVELVVDAIDGTTDNPWHAYLRFDLPADVDASAATAASLVLHTSQHTNADSESTGVVWRVEAFDDASLALGMPARPDAQPLSNGVGPIAEDEAVSIALDAARVVVGAGGSIYLGVLPDLDNGPSYYNTDGAAPPRLELTLP